MKKLFGILSAVILLGGIVGNAGATVVNFDDLISGYYPSVYTNGVTITDLMGGDVKVLYDGQEGVGYSSPYMSVAASQWTVGYGLLFTFDDVVSNLSLTGGDSGGDTDGWSMEAFDINNVSLGSIQTALNFSGPDPVNPISGTTYGDYRTLTLDVSGIKTLKVVQTVWGSSWDDLTFTAAAVPEPATMLLLGSGLLGLAGLKRRLRKH
jgi:hypothetical protein